METSQLKNTLLTSVLEIRFLRKIPAEGKSAYRRMLCTNSTELLDSFNGRQVLNYRVPTKYPKFDPASNNIVITWDILMQNFRCVSTYNCQVLKTFPPNDNFWEYFNKNILIMNTAEKILYMNS